MIADKLDGKNQVILGEMWREACEKGKDLNFKIVSGSMSPTIEVGDVVKVTRVEASRLRIGDIVAFQDGQNVVVHRIIGKSWSNQQLRFRHRGDAGASSGRILEQNIIGGITVIEKAGREIHLDSRRHIMGSRILGLRLLLVDTIDRIQSRPLRILIHESLRPCWKACRALFLRHF